MAIKLKLIYFGKRESKLMAILHFGLVMVNKNIVSEIVLMRILIHVLKKLIFFACIFCASVINIG